MTTRGDNLTSPFVDGELTFVASPTGKTTTVVTTTPFLSATPASRRPTPPLPAPPFVGAGATEAPTNEMVDETSVEGLLAEVFEEAQQGSVAELVEETAEEAVEEVVEEAEVFETSGETLFPEVRFEGPELESATETVEEAATDTESDTVAEAAFDLGHEYEDELAHALEPEADEALTEETGEGEAEPLVASEDEQPKGTVTVILDQPTETDDKFTLKSSDGPYNKTLGPKDAVDLVPGEKILRFDGVDPTKSFQLTHQRSATSKTALFPKVGYPGLTSHFTDTRTAGAFLSMSTQPPSIRAGGGAIDPELVEGAPGLVNPQAVDP